MAKALIIYASSTGQTKGIADLIAEGMRIAGLEVDLADAVNVKNVEQFAGYDIYCLGSATYHGEMLQSMKTLLFLANKADLSGKVGGAFGSFGWSGEAPERIFDTMKHVLKMDMVADPLRLKSAALDGAIPMAHDYGKQLAAKL